MATFTFFDEWKRYMGGGSTPDVDVANDQFSIYLSNDTPAVATDAAKADMVAITEQNGYTQTNLTTSWVEQSAGNGIWVLRNNADVSWTASGGSFGPFRYAVVIDNTITTPVDLLVGYWDNGSSTTITNGNTFKVDLNATFDIFTFDG